MHDGQLAIRFAVMALSLTIVAASIVAISLKERSWINWYSLLALQTVGMLYILPGLFMLSFGSSGSLYAYAYCYTTYALVSVCNATGYCLLRPITCKRREKGASNGQGVGAWFLLISGILLYLPVLKAFQKDILQPREIYAGFSAAGYGINFFGSAVLVTLAFLLYLFKPRKRAVGTTVFMISCAIMIYLHGSKGQLIVLGFIAILHRVYAARRRAPLLKASALLLSITFFAGVLFAAFGSSGDLVSLAMDMANYSDAGRNAMAVIDDSRLSFFHGQLELEDELYSRTPRLAVPDKPRAFGQVRLAQRYYPEWFRDSAGTPSFGIGMQYADFGALSILMISACGMVTGWLARSAVVSMERHPTPGRFLLLLFFSGVSIVPLGAGYLLPETVLIALVIDWFQAVPLSFIKSSSKGRRAFIESAG